MKRILKYVLLALATFSSACQNKSEAVQIPVIRYNPAKFKAFITRMYNEKLYESYDFLQNHCSDELLNKLQEEYANAYDGTGYASWLFRSGQQDSKEGSDGKTHILDVTSDGEWYRYKALDMGWEFTNRIKLTGRDGKIIIEDISK